MLSVEDRAEIRRLHRSERMPIKVIALVMGISKRERDVDRDHGHQDAVCRSRLVKEARPEVCRPSSHCSDGLAPRVELRGLEPLTPTLPVSGTACA